MARLKDGPTAQERAAKAVSLYLYGLSTPAIAERLGVDRTRVATYIRNAGIKPDPARRRYDGCGSIAQHLGRRAAVARR